jgi:hypothetical protein
VAPAHMAKAMPALSRIVFEMEWIVIGRSFLIAVWNLTTDREIDGGRVGRCVGGHTKMSSGYCSIRGTQHDRPDPPQRFLSFEVELGV